MPPMVKTYRLFGVLEKDGRTIETYGDYLIRHLPGARAGVRYRVERRDTGKFVSTASSADDARQIINILSGGKHAFRNP